MISRSFLFVLIIITMAACSPIYKKDYRFTPPTSDIGKMCAIGCLDKQNACKTNCKNEKLNCQKVQDLKAENEYLRYVNEQNKKGEPIVREKWSFTNHAFCNTNSCDQECDVSQRICHSTCGGGILETTRCTAFCD